MNQWIKVPSPLNVTLWILFDFFCSYFFSLSLLILAFVLTAVFPSPWLMQLRSCRSSDDLRWQNKAILGQISEESMLQLQNQDLINCLFHDVHRAYLSVCLSVWSPDQGLFMKNWFWTMVCVLSFCIRLKVWKIDKTTRLGLIESSFL